MCSGRQRFRAWLSVLLLMSTGIVRAQSSTKHYYYTDPQGTPLAKADAQGNIVERYEYTPYGEPVPGMGGVSNGPGYTGHVNDPESGLIYMQARYYDPMVGRFLSVDPVAPSQASTHGFNRYIYANNNPVANIDPDGRDAIPVTFPDYKVATPLGKIGGLGHAGIVLIDNKTGHARYFEYGRYDKANIGIVRTRQVPNVTMGKNGLPTTGSLKELLGAVSHAGGDGGRVEGVYIKNGNYKEMLQYANGRMSQNRESSRDKYSLVNNNCTTFCKSALEAGGELTPSMVDPRPNSYIDELRDSFGSPVNYDPSTHRMTCGGSGGDCAQFSH